MCIPAADVSIWLPNLYGQYEPKVSNLGATNLYRTFRRMDMSPWTMTRVSSPRIKNKENKVHRIDLFEWFINEGNLYNYTVSVNVIAFLIFSIKELSSCPKLWFIDCHIFSTQYLKL